MKIKVDKHALKLTFIFSVIHFLLALYYAYFCLGNDFIVQGDFLKILMGGIRVEESGNLFCVILYLFPRCLFCVYVANGFMKDLKTNFLYIFLRTNKREIWLRGAIVKTAMSTLCYESFFGIFIVAIKIFMWNDVHFAVDEFLIMFVMEFMQVFMLVLFSNILLLFFSETAGVFGTLLELSVPTLITGVTYENNGAWQYPAKCIPFNLGNYNYMSSCNMNMFIAALVILVLCIVMYVIAAWRINRYELI